MILYKLCQKIYIDIIATGDWNMQNKKEMRLKGCNKMVIDYPFKSIDSILHAIVVGCLLQKKKKKKKKKGIQRQWHAWLILCAVHIVKLVTFGL